MATKEIALAATGDQGKAFEAWGAHAVTASNTKQWETGRQLLDLLTGICKDGADCIGRLFIFSHAWHYGPKGNRGGVMSDGPNNSGLYFKKESKDHEDARDLSDLQSAIDKQEIRFCEPCRIVLTGCRVAASDFPSELARITGCSVIAAQGSSRPKEADRKNPPGDETGKWESVPGGTEERKNEHYLGWKEYKKENGKVIEKELGNNLDVWGDKKSLKKKGSKIKRALIIGAAIIATILGIAWMNQTTGIRQCIRSVFNSSVQSCNTPAGPKVPTFINNDYLGYCEDWNCAVLEHVACGQTTSDGVYHGTTAGGCY